MEPMSTTTPEDDTPEAEVEHEVPATLLELHEVLEWSAAVQAEAHKVLP